MILSTTGSVQHNFIEKQIGVAPLVFCLAIMSRQYSSKSSFRTRFPIISTPIDTIYAGSEFSRIQPLRYSYAHDVGTYYVPKNK